jgi:hypothetical protein
VADASVNPNQERRQIAMKLTTLTALAVLTSSGYAFAGAGAPVPERSEGGPPSGRPAAVLDESRCASVWDKARGDAASYLVNFERVDTDKDGKISEAEFKAGCSKGWVQEHASLPANSGGGQTPQNPTE